MLIIRIHTLRSTKSKKIRFIIGISHPYLLILLKFQLICRIHNLKRILPHKLIITIHQHLHIILVTKVKPSIDDIISSEVSLQVLNELHSIFGEINAFQILYRTIHIVICGIIINKYNMIVLIFLLNY